MKPYAIGLYEKAMPASMGWREKLTCAKELGYDFVEISIDETPERLARLTWSPKERAQMVALMQEMGIGIGSMCLSGHRKYPLGGRSAEERARSMEIMTQAISLAGDLGIRMIQLAGYDTYYEAGDETTRAYFLSNLRQATALAAKGGVLLGFETMETEFMNTVEKAMAYVALVNSPYLGVYPDCGNLTNAANGSLAAVQADLALGQGHLLAMHLKETLPGKFREIPYFTGHVDFPGVIAAAWALGVRRYVTELWDVGKADWQGEIRAAVTAFDRLLKAQSAEGLGK